MAKIETDNSSNGVRFWIIASSLVIIIAGMKAAAAIVVPFLLSLFIAGICAPPFFWLKKKKLNDALSLAIIFFSVFLIYFFFIALLGTSVSGFADALPFYESRLKEFSISMQQYLVVNNLLDESINFAEKFNPSSLITIAGNIFSGFGSILSNSFIILITVAFIILELASFRRKLYFLSDSSLSKADLIVSNLNRYFGIKALVSLITGILVGVSLHIIGVDFPYLWGTLAFLLNFIPNIGSILAAIPAVLVALIQLGVGSAIMTAGVFVVVNFVIGNALEPRMMGKSLGLSTLVVFLSLLFWGWVLGTVGMLLSVPLTMSLKIAFDSSEGGQVMSVLLGDGSAIEEKDKT